MSCCGNPFVPSAGGGGGADGAGVAISAGTQMATSGTVAFANSNGVTFGMSGSSQITASVSLAAIKTISAGTTNVQGPGVSFANGGGVSFGANGSTLTASVAAETPFGVSAGTQSASTGTLIFSNSNNITFGMSGSSRITASASFPAETPFGISAGTQSVSTGTLVFSNSNGITFGMSGSSRITMSVSDTFSYSGWSPYAQANGIPIDPGQSSMQISPVDVAGNVAFSNIALPVNFTHALLSVGTVSVTFNYALYTRNVSTLSLLHSTSFSQSFVFSTNLSATLFNGFRIVTAPWTSTLTKGNYWAGVQYQSTTSSQDASFSAWAMNGLASGTIFSGIVGVATNVTNQVQLGIGYYTATITTPPISIPFASIVASAVNGRRPWMWTLGMATA